MQEANSKQDVSFFIDLLHQLPGLIAVCDKDNTCMYSNNYTAKLFGFPSEESMIGTGPYDMKCPAVESADDFISQNKFVYQTANDLTVLDIHQYSHGLPKILLTKKTPYRENGEIIGTICHCVELHSSALSEACGALIQSDKKYYSKSKPNERSYTIGTEIKSKKLTERELECIFYILRCNTMKQTAKLLEISPRTVESHLEQIKFKLNCNNRSEVIEHCLSEGLLNYVPGNIQSKNISKIIHITDNNV